MNKIFIWLKYLFDFLNRWIWWLQGFIEKLGISVHPWFCQTNIKLIHLGGNPLKFLKRNFELRVWPTIISNPFSGDKRPENGKSSPWPNFLRIRCCKYLVAFLGGSTETVSTQNDLLRAKKHATNLGVHDNIQYASYVPCSWKNGGAVDPVSWKNLRLNS